MASTAKQEDYDPMGEGGSREQDHGVLKAEGGTEGGGVSEQARTGPEGGYYDEEGDEEEDDAGFAVKLSTQALSSMPTTSTSAPNVRGTRTAPQAMKTFNAGGVVGPSGTPASGGPNVGVTAKVSASLAPLTTLGTANKVSIPPNPAIGPLLMQAEDSRFVAHLEASALENYPDKPWNREGADQSDFFNYGFTEASWTLYREKQLALRRDNGSQEASSYAGSQPRSAGAHQNRSHRMDTSGSSAPSHSHDSRSSHDTRFSSRDNRDDSRRSNRDFEDRRDTSDRSSGNRTSDRSSRQTDRSSSDRYEDRRGGSRGNTRDSRDDRRGDNDDYDSSSRKRTRSPDHRDSRDDENRKKARR